MLNLSPTSCFNNLCLRACQATPFHHAAVIYTYMPCIISCTHRMLASCTIILTASIPIKLQIYQYGDGGCWNWWNIHNNHVSTRTHRVSFHRRDNPLWRYPLSEDEKNKPWSHRRLLCAVYKIIHCFIVSTPSPPIVVFLFARCLRGFCRWQWLSPSRRVAGL